ncbi:30S ribosomal protein S15 [Candidatus Woesearchaeota archaeon]|nr:30S ribosomal protein S15 [Candidatus Woesearchaeota archaeon]
MARMHSGARGKSGSTKPVQRTKQIWVRYKPKEAEFLIVKLAKEGKTPSQIGIVLRDLYGIPDVRVMLEKSITQILEEKKLLPELPEDLMALIKKSIMLRKHMEINKNDKTAFRGLQLTESKIKRMVKYYKKSGKIKEGWKYDPEKIKLVIS